jgi:inosine/xanthosine triphosphate pyrophosphatase family protein
MPKADPIRVVYVTSSQHKVNENEILRTQARLRDGTPVSARFEFIIQSISIKEVLDVDIASMVIAEVADAYSQLKVPCIVEHAGLIFSEYSSYPGGLTKPMWNELGAVFVEETRSANRPAVARAVVAYCDGMTTQTFVGETAGTIAPAPRGSREFYWDTVFIPDGQDAGARRTYAEIVDDLGLDDKVLHFSQSTKAMLGFLEYRLGHDPVLWRTAA